MDIESINSYEEAISYWHSEYGHPDKVFTLDEIEFIEMKLGDLKKEKETIDHEISQRDIKQISQFKINRPIEIFFLLKAGATYLMDCELNVRAAEDDLVSDYSHNFDERDRWTEDGLFPRDYNEE